MELGYSERELLLIRTARLWALLATLETNENIEQLSADIAANLDWLLGEYSGPDGFILMEPIELARLAISPAGVMH